MSTTLTPSHPVARRAAALVALLGAMLAMAGATSAPAQAANGCGPNDWRSRLVPERPLGVDFHTACNIHDGCYGTPWYRVGFSPQAARRACDDAFYGRMSRRCYMAFSTSGSLYPLCQRIAYLYYSKVRQHGQQPYRNAQAAIGLRVSIV